MTTGNRIQPQGLGLGELCPALTRLGIPGLDGAQIRVSNADRPGLHVIEDFAPGLGVSLATCSDQTGAGRYLSPILEHGTALHTVHWGIGPGLAAPTNALDQTAPISERPKADALIALTPGLDEPESPQPAAVLRIGMPTADCLTWAFAGACPHPDSTSNPPALRIFGLVHLGWRGLTQALHWMVARDIINQITHDLGPRYAPSFWKQAYHYLGPSIFGSDYPCGRQDVGEALLAMPERAQHLMPVAGGLRCSKRIADAAIRLADLKDDSCSPDLQLLTLLDLFCLGADPARIIVHRVNTARSAHYPSYRRDERGRAPSQQPRRRLVTLLDIQGQPHPSNQPKTQDESGPSTLR